VILYMSDYKNVGRKTLIKWLDGAAYGLERLYDELQEKLTITPEKSKLSRKKVSKMEASMGEISSDTAKDLQQFYTIDELAEECMEKFIENCPEFWGNDEVFYLEPSAGKGDILKKLPKGRRAGVDLDPQDDEVMKMNYFDVTRKTLGIEDERPLVLIGNPPFDDVALKFFQHSTDELRPDCIAWILPNTWLKRKGKRNELDPLYHLSYVMNINCCYLHKGTLYNLPTMFGIWKKREIPLEIKPTIMGHPEFELVEGTDNKMLALEEGKTQNNKYFWMRRALKHKKKIVQSPVFRSGAELMDDYRGTAGMKKSPLDKLLMSFCFKVHKEKDYDKLFNYFSSFNWKDTIGQFQGRRAKKDWAVPTLIHISKVQIFTAINEGSEFRPYMETVDGEEVNIKHERSKIVRNTVKNKYKKGGKKKTRKRRSGRL
jgi:hypothetical protein